MKGFVESEDRDGDTRGSCCCGSAKVQIKTIYRVLKAAPAAGADASVFGKCASGKSQSFLLVLLSLNQDSTRLVLGMTALTPGTHSKLRKAVVTRVEYY